MKRVLISTMFFLWLGLVQVVAQEGQIDWNRAQQIHQKFLRGDKLTDEEQAYHDRAAKALRAKSGQKSDDGIDWAKAERLHQKFVRGEKLTEEERAYHDRAAKVIQSRSKSQSPPGPVIKPPAGLRPLSDMSAQDRYKGQDGGLYGGGKNEPPEKHLQAAMVQAKLIQPLDADGKPDDDGKIVLISVGMSNTTQEFSTFIRLANADFAKSPKVVIVDGCKAARQRTFGRTLGLAAHGMYWTSGSSKRALRHSRCKWPGSSKPFPLPSILGSSPNTPRYSRGTWSGFWDSCITDSQTFASPISPAGSTPVMPGRT